MGKKARQAEKKIKVDDAADVIAVVQRWADSPPPADPALDWVRGVSWNSMKRWDRSPVVLRADSEFVGALLNSNTDVDLVPDWLTRFPFNAVAYTLPEPVSLHDGHRMCHYRGMIVSGINTRKTPNAVLSKLRRLDGGVVEHSGASHSDYVNIPAAQGVRCLWVYGTDVSPGLDLQTVTLMFKGDLAPAGTLQKLIDGHVANAQMIGRSGGDELPTLIPLTLGLLLYTAATDPEIDWPPAERVSRPHQLRDARVGNVGWRVGAALRQARRPGPAVGLRDADDPGTPGLGGWRLPPHIRKAHWHRVRVAERNQLGEVIGNRSGVEGLDWHYEMRWYPPAAVNANPDAAPTVRDL